MIVSEVMFGTSALYALFSIVESKPSLSSSSFVVFESLSFARLV